MGNYSEVTTMEETKNFAVGDIVTVAEDNLYGTRLKVGDEVQITGVHPQDRDRYSVKVTKVMGWGADHSRVGAAFIFRTNHLVAIIPEFKFVFVFGDEVQAWGCEGFTVVAAHEDHYWVKDKEGERFTVPAENVSPPPPAEWKVGTTYTSGYGTFTVRGVDPEDGRAWIQYANRVYNSKERISVSGYKEVK